MNGESNVFILVCYHRLDKFKHKFVIANEVLKPIINGADFTDEKYISHIQNLCDKSKARLYLDNGAKDNISYLNNYFGEFSGIYYMWKNINAKYYGLMHYRRVFDFSQKFHKNYEVKINGMFMILRILLLNSPMKFFEKVFSIHPKSIENLIKDYDIIKICGVSITEIHKENITWYQQYKYYHNILDLDICLQYLISKYPDIDLCINKVLHNRDYKPSLYCNFIMNKENFHSYCEWIFDLLFAVKDKIDYKIYKDTYQERVFAFISERLFNIWLEYNMMKKPNLKIKELPLIFLKHKTYFGWNENKNVFYMFGLRIYSKKSKIK